MLSKEPRLSSWHPKALRTRCEQMARARFEDIACSRVKCWKKEASSRQ